MEWPSSNCSEIGRARRKEIWLGVVSHRTLNADTPTEVANEVRKALKYVDIEICSSRPIAAMGGKVPTVWSLSTKTAATAQGANIIRREYGLPETYVPCADARLSQDLVP